MSLFLFPQLKGICAASADARCTSAPPSASSQRRVLTSTTSTVRFGRPLLPLPTPPAPLILRLLLQPIPIMSTTVLMRVCMMLPPVVLLVRQTLAAGLMLVLFMAVYVPMPCQDLVASIVTASIPGRVTLAQEFTWSPTLTASIVGASWLPRRRRRRITRLTSFPSWPTPMTTIVYAAPPPPHCSTPH